MFWLLLGLVEEDKITVKDPAFFPHLHLWPPFCYCPGDLYSHCSFEHADRNDEQLFQQDHGVENFFFLWQWFQIRRLHVDSKDIIA